MNVKEILSAVAAANGPNHLEKHCRRDVEAVTKLFHLLSVQLQLFPQNQGHNTLAA
jgi:hypothetical protein